MHVGVKDYAARCQPEASVCKPKGKRADKEFNAL